MKWPGGLGHASENGKHAAVHEIILEGDDVDLTQLPIQHCWPGDIAPLLSWGLVVTKGPHKARQNLGIYRQQVLGRNKLIMLARGIAVARSIFAIIVSRIRIRRSQGSALCSAVTLRPYSVRSHLCLTH